MLRIRAIIPCLGLVLGTHAGTWAQQQQPSPADQFKALLKEYERASSSGRVLTDAERLVFVGQTYRLHDKLAARFIELAEKNPAEPFVVDALVQAIAQVNSTPWPVEVVGNDKAWLRAFDLLKRDHLASDKLGPACARLSGGFRQEYEAFLRAVLDKSPHPQVKAQACLALARFLSNRFQRVELMRSEPDLAREFADLFGKEYLAGLLGQNLAEVNREVESLLARAGREFGAIKLPDGETVTKKVQSELFELRQLAVGCQAPEIEGEDQEGKRFKLSDYRGKAVLLDFWSEY